jgi:hypothetical protein
MKKMNQKKNHSGFDDGFASKASKQQRSLKNDKSSKKRLSIYDDYDDDDYFSNNEKFSKRHK